MEHNGNETYEQGTNETGQDGVQLVLYLNDEKLVAGSKAWRLEDAMDKARYSLTNKVCHRLEPALNEVGREGCLGPERGWQYENEWAWLREHIHDLYVSEALLIFGHDIDDDSLPRVEIDVAALKVAWAVDTLENYATGHTDIYDTFPRIKSEYFCSDGMLRLEEDDPGLPIEDAIFAVTSEISSNMKIERVRQRVIAISLAIDSISHCWNCKERINEQNLLLHLTDYDVLPCQKCHMIIWSHRGGISSWRRAINSDVSTDSY